MLAETFGFDYRPKFIVSEGAENAPRVRFKQQQIHQNIRPSLRNEEKPG